jgi:site-specific DNA-methyltransferase (adenine-specific)
MENTLYYGDNLEILRKYIKDEGIDLIYLDPPFNSNANYNVLFKDEKGKSASQIQAFTDFWHWDEESAKTYDYLVTNSQVPAKVSSLISALHNFLGDNQMCAYLVMMTARLLQLHRVLRQSGSLYFHCDPTASHYIKLVLDAIFGQENFRNEIIWSYSTSGRPKDSFAWKHDTIFCYGKKAGETYFNAKDARIPYSENYVKTHFPYKDKDGRLYRKRFDAGKWRIYYADEGMIPNDVWFIPYVNSMSPERLGYPTQKPLSLLEAIIKASSKEGDIILDPFCGCGTTIDAVEKVNAEQKTKRSWIGIDITHLAINLIKRRITDKYPNIKFEVFGEPKDLGGARDLALKDRFQFEWWALSLIDARPANDKKKGADQGVDGIILLQNPNMSKPIKALVQVKSGHVKSDMVTALKGAMDRDKAEYSIFITLEEPTQPMIKEALEKGFETEPLTKEKIPKVEIITIKELLEGKIPKLKLVYNKINISYQKAEKNKEEKGKGYYKKL